MHLNSADLVSNIHPMEIRSALPLRIICAWVFVAYKVFSLFLDRLLLVSEVSVTYLLLLHTGSKKDKIYLEKDLQGDFFF